MTVPSKKIKDAVPLVMVGAGGVSADELERFVGQGISIEFGGITTKKRDLVNSSQYGSKYINNVRISTLHSTEINNPGMDFVESRAQELIDNYKKDNQCLAINIAGESPRDSISLIKRAVACGFTMITVDTSMPIIYWQRTRSMSSDLDTMIRFIVTAHQQVESNGSLILLKIPADLPIDSLVGICDALQGSRFFDGIIAGGSSIGAMDFWDDGTPIIKNVRHTEVGLCGPAIKPKAIAQAKSLVDYFQGKKLVISGGGISTKEDVRDRLRLGVDGVQVTSAFIESGKDAAFIRSLS